MNSKTTSLVQLRRGHLAKPAGRGDPRKKNIWVVHGFDDSRIVLVSDLRLDHFFFTEGDPAVTEADYLSADSDRILGADGICFDAVVTHRDRHRECRLVLGAATDASDPGQAERMKFRTFAARQMGATYVEITATELDSAQQRIRNWERLLAIHRRCRHRHLGVLEQVVLARITQQGAATVQEVLGWFTDESPALLVASVAHLLRSRKLTSDLDSSAWSMHTRLGVET
jgi:hypothetical protein